MQQNLPGQRRKTTDSIIDEVFIFNLFPVLSEVIRYGRPAVSQ